MEELGQENYLQDEEQAIPKDTNCYCQMCKYKSKSLERVTNNFYYGFLLFPLWFYNFSIYIYALTLPKAYELSENILWDHKDEITLSNFDSEDNLISCVIVHHEEQSAVFDRWVGWSVMASAVLAILVLVVYVMMIE